MPVDQTTTVNPAAAGYSPYTMPPTAPQPPVYAVNPNVSPGLAFLLGLIPGVGAIYNAQYAKGLIHVLVLGVLISIANSGIRPELQPLMGLLITAWFFYMAFEAYHTAKRRQMGQVVDEFSSLVPLRGRAGAFPAGPIVLIALGVLFLLVNFDILSFREIGRFWPVFLIVLGAYMLFVRLTGGSRNSEVANERR
jgi:LiaI-LiaF-like transmembrane region